MSGGLPLLLAGPIVRRLTESELVLWLVTTRPVQITADIAVPGQPLQSQVMAAPLLTEVPVGQHAFVYLLRVVPAQPFQAGQCFEYDVWLDDGCGPQCLKALQPTLLYEGYQRPSLVFKEQLDVLLHGSCRKPHYPGDDALLRADEQLSLSLKQQSERPALLLMSGDQIYADDVAGPMLSAIHQVIRLLGLHGEVLTGATVADSEALYADTAGYYRREELLPHNEANESLRDKFFGGARKPIFTADGAHNHLITLSEVLAMYLLVWSPTLWQRVRLSIDDVAEPYRDRYLEEQKHLDGFVRGLPQVQRAFAHLPVYMIFDDHDITDDWNLTRGWEEAAYSHPLSRRIIGNALIGYWLCQGWGNAPQQFSDELVAQAVAFFRQPETSGQDGLIDTLLEFEHWHYSLPSTPKLVVLDTRTRRWWSESRLGKPSGLMDWEGLSDMQQLLIGEPAVIMVSPAPIFGVKVIETIQRVFTYFGHALMVDAENWMAHPGSANTLLNIFRHPKTPQRFVILSGDVHYSFVYDVLIRFRKNSPHIWQITSSGLKNEFPRRLLPWLDRMNRVLYGSRSPLNWFTKRRRMRVKARRPEGCSGHLYNGSGLGLLTFSVDGEPEQIKVLKAGGGEVVFPAPHDELPLVSD